MGGRAVGGGRKRGDGGGGAWEGARLVGASRALSLLGGEEGQDLGLSPEDGRDGPSRDETDMTASGRHHGVDVGIRAHVPWMGGGGNHRIILGAQQQGGAADAVEAGARGGPGAVVLRATEAMQGGGDGVVEGADGAGALQG